MKDKLKAILEKYEERIDECNERFDEDVLSLKIKDNTQERIDWLHNDIQSLNAQIGCYECMIKDMKELLNEASR